MKRAFSGFVDVRPGEGRAAASVFLTLFLLIAGHTILETARDTLFLQSLEPNRLPLVYGCVALVRRSLLAESADGLAGRADWPLLASLGVRGAKIVSAPLALVRSTASPETLESRPAEALLVTQELERVLPESASGLARLAAGLAADSARSGP